MKNFVPKNYPWSMQGLKDFIYQNGLKSRIILEGTNALAVMVDNFKESQALGKLTEWCICQHESSWRQYVSKDNNIQVFFYNFNVNPTGDLAMVGATFKRGKHIELICSFSRENKPIADRLYGSNDAEALNNIVMIPLFHLSLNNIGLVDFDYTPTTQRVIREEENEWPIHLSMPFIPGQNYYGPEIDYVDEWEDFDLYDYYD